MARDEQWFTETMDELGTGFSLKLSDAGKLFEVQSPYQKLCIYETSDFGYLMTLDGAVMLTSRDNFVYHEMMSHPALFSHPAPKRVCIIGGGDCGTLREVLKHDVVESVTQIDIDEEVTRASEKYFPELCESNDDPRATLMFDDGIKWMQEAAPGSLDIIIVDSTDPVGPGVVLYSEAFFRSCWDALATGGLLIQQSESPLLHLDSIIKPMHATMRQAGFEAVQLHQYAQVSYPSGWWSSSIASKDSAISFTREAEAQAKKFSTAYYNAALHSASMALPQFVLDALET